MRLSLLLCTLLFGCGLSAQYGLRVEPASVEKDVMIDDLKQDYQDITPITVTNDSPKSVDVVREQVIIGKPGSWSYGTFNRRNRLSPYLIDEKATGRGAAVTLSPGESATFYLVLQPNGMSGDGRVELRFSDLNVPGSTLGTAVITSEIGQRTAAGTAIGANANGGLSDAGSRPAPTSVRLFPNPARERFFVEAPRGVKLGRVEIRNTLGSTLKKFDKPAGKDGYQIQSLPDGLYMISIYDDRGKKLKTLRLLHRQFGA